MRVVNETPAVLPKPSLASRLRHLTLRLLIVFILLVTTLLLIDYYNSRHPQFGRTYHTSAHDLNVARSDRFASFLSRTLPRSITQSSFYPDRLKDQPKYLRIGPHRLEWSIGGTDTGWLYFWNVDGTRRYPWEFAKATGTNFLTLRPTDIPTIFINPFNLPTNAPSTNAINVKVGAIIFARHTDAPNTTYILHLSKQQNDKLALQYWILAQ